MSIGIVKKMCGALTQLSAEALGDRAAHAREGLASCPRPRPPATRRRAAWVEDASPGAVDAGMPPCRPRWPPSRRHARCGHAGSRAGDTGRGPCRARPRYAGPGARRAGARRRRPRRARRAPATSAGFRLVGELASGCRAVGRRPRPRRAVGVGGRGRSPRPRRRSRRSRCRRARCCPSSTRILRSTPSSKASISMLTLPVSISPRISPLATVSPSALSHWRIVPSSMS